MRKLRVALLALALVGLVASAANAAGQAWFTLEGSSDPGVTATSGPGQTLIITKPRLTGTTVLTIGYNVTANVGNMAGWHIDLFPPTSGDVTASNPAWLGTGYTSNEGGTVPQLLFNFGQTSISLTGSQGLVGTFDLTVVKSPGTTGPRVIFGSFGDGAQGDGGGLWRGYVGANPNQTIGNRTYGFNGYDFATYSTRPSLPVIEINNIPEPATLALLGLGVVCLIRRRKA